MEEKIFQVPSECRNLIPYFWGLKHAACGELKQNGIEEEPAKASFDEMQKICDQNPFGPLANYVRELKKGFRMSKEDLLAYDQQIGEIQGPLDENDPLDFNVDDAADDLYGDDGTDDLYGDDTGFDPDGDESFWQDED
ncbi:MAG: hypothetical protein HQM13_08800 [SAR324 cluster bacterium]|nr:hypothetical protein [SAR324 cluster bacterium]